MSIPTLLPKGNSMSGYEQPYHGPHVVLSRSEIERLHTLIGSIPWEDGDDVIYKKLDAAIKSHPDFLKPAK